MNPPCVLSYEVSYEVSLETPLETPLEGSFLEELVSYLKPLKHEQSLRFV